VNEQAMKAFLDQFAASRRDFDQWPPWMRESAKVVAATFPKTHPVQEKAVPSDEPPNEESEGT
jgi:hypothetical protein